MKKIISTFISVIIIATCFVACGKKESDVTATELLSAAVESGVSFDELEEVEKEKISFYFEISEETYDEFAGKIAGSAASADEIIIFKAKTKDDVNEIKDALNSRLEKRKTDFKSYSTVEYEKLNSSQVYTNGNYVYLIVSKDNATVQSAIKEKM